MASLTGTAIALIFCLIFGQFSMALLIAGFLSLLGIIFNSLQKTACFIFITTVTCAFVISSKSELAFFIPAITLWLTKEVLDKSLFPKNIWIIFAPLAIYCITFQDRDIKILIFVIFVLALPNFIFSSIPKYINSRKWNIIMVVAIIGVAIVNLLLSMPIYDGKTAIIESGVWAKTEVKMNDVRNLNIESIYSYSEFKDLLEAHVIKPSDINDTYAEAWLITPTQPLDNDTKRKLCDWIKHGGRLIIVSDHTDLFGHGRVINSFISDLGLETSYTAFFPITPNLKAMTNWGENAWLKTTNVQSGLFLWPEVTARWVNESADYSSRNFFGPLLLSADDTLGRRVIAGTKSWGKGRLVIFGDSTSLSNFALYKPHNINLIEKIRTGSRFACLLPFISGILVVSLLISLFFKKLDILLVIPVIGLFAILDCQTIPVNWKPFAYWSGNEKAVMEFGHIQERLSTAYAVSFLSGLKPRWVSNINHNMTGFWVGSMPPPNSRWRWIDTSDANGCLENYDKRLDTLLYKISAGSPYLWNGKLDPNHAKIGGIWTDNAMGDWWFDRGISKSKQQRIQAWLAWLSSQPLPEPIHPIVLHDAFLKDYKLRIDTQDWQTVTIPELPFKNDEIYIGRGISATIVNAQGKTMFLGTKSFTESWNSANAWVLIPFIPDSNVNE